MTEHGDRGRWVINSNAILHQQREMRARQIAKQADVQEQPIASQGSEQPSTQTLTNGGAKVIKQINTLLDDINESLDRIGASFDRMEADSRHMNEVAKHMETSMDRMEADSRHMGASLNRWNESVGGDSYYSVDGRTRQTRQTRSVPYDYESWRPRSAYRR